MIQALQRGEDLPSDWARELFPPEKREYELVYHGKEREEDIIAGTMAVPLQAERTFGKNGVDWHNKLILGDNLQVMRTLLEQKKAGKLCNSDGSQGVRLIYIDPPFATKQEFRGSQDQKAYQDKISGSKFLEFIRKRLVLMRELLSDNGLLYVHLDYRKSHYVKTLLDEIFGEHNFLNEIAWCYGERELATRHWNRKHDNILVYARNLKQDTYVFNWKEAVGQYSQGTFDKYEHTDETGRLFQLRGRNVSGSPWRGKHGIPLKVEISNPEWVYRDYLDTKEGIRPRDWWGDIPFLNRAAADRYNYPSAKNPVLLSRIIRVSSNNGDLVLDAFAGSGTTCAVAEKLGRRWIGIDCGKLSIYTIQKRMLNLKADISNRGAALKAKPFTLYNAGLYDFSKLKQLPWADWRFFCLQLFGCKEELHTIGGLQLDGKLKGASVLVFNHHEKPGAVIDEETVRSIHAAIGKKIGRKFYIIAPRGVFGFQQDYIDLDGVRYYAMRVPYSIINELHQREFTALKQPDDETAVNDTVDSVGFDFIQPPKVKWTVGVNARKGQLIKEAFLKIDKFESRARLRGEDTHGGIETFSMLMLDFDYNGDVFDLDAVFYNHQMEEAGWEARFSAESIGNNLMAVFIDTHGNEAREVIPLAQFGLQPSKPVAKKVEAKATPVIKVKALPKIKAKIATKVKPKTKPKLSHAPQP